MGRATWILVFVALGALTEAAEKKAEQTKGGADTDSLKNMVAQMEKTAGGGLNTKIKTDQTQDDKVRQNYLKAKNQNGNAKQEEQQARDLVDSDRQEVQEAVKNMRNAAASFRHAKNNDTQAMTLAINLAEDAQSQARDAGKQKKEQATKDFSTALSALQQAAPTGQWKDNEKAARQKAEALDKLDEEEDKYARGTLRDQRKAADGKVRQSYRAAHQAVNNLLKDRHRLAKAQRHAGEKENVYEREEDQNEQFAEDRQGEAENHNDNARGAIEDIFERAEDYLMDRSNRYRQEASHKRHRAVQEAVETLTKEAQKDANQRLFADPGSSSTLALVTNLCLVAAASVGLVALRRAYVNYNKIRAQPVLG